MSCFFGCESHLPSWRAVPLRAAAGLLGVAGLFVGLIFAGNLVPAWAQTTIRNPAASAIPKAPLPDAIDATAGDTVAPVVPEPIDPETPQMGHPSAPGLMTLLHNEMATGMKKRKIEGKFTQFRRYTAGKLNATAGPRTGSELTGNCRLKWYDHLMRNPLEAPIEAEQFTRQLHQDMCGDHRGLERAMVTAGLKLDLAIGSPRSFAPVGSPDEALDTVKQALTNAQLYYASALAPLTKAEVQELVRGLYPILTGQCKVGHTLASRSSGRRLCNLMEKIDRTAMHRAAMALVPLTDPDLLQQLGQLDQSTTLAVGPTAVAGTTGPIVGRIDTPGGTIVIGDRGTNTYQLDSMAGVNVVIDLGGNDVYYEGTVSTGRPVLIVIDLDGNDAYRGKKPGIQGSGILGISMLLDAAGSDTYLAADVAQGSCLAGAGILIDYGGNDIYKGIRRVQGCAVGGLAVLLDRGGDDKYQAAMWAQGFGGPLGFGLLEDMQGADHFYAGGYYYDSYDETPGYEGWAQGVGAGPRQVANGGIGVILDGGGDDIYEFDYLAHGGGYWCGTGFARDFGGNDQRIGATRRLYNGGRRTQRMFQRFGCGYGCHYSAGFLFDDQGNDTYNGTIMGTGFAWDVSIGVLCDFGGNDQYLASGGHTQGSGAQAGLGLLFDYDGDDYYKGYGQGRASAGISYHDLPQCGGNFGFVIDYGGEDKYGCRAKNNSYIMRASSGGFLIDRPRRAETAEKPDPEVSVGG